MVARRSSAEPGGLLKRKSLDPKGEEEELDKGKGKNWLQSMMAAGSSSSSGTKRSWRRRWRDAYSSVLAFQLPSYVLDGRHCIRPSVDETLLADEHFIQLAPLLSPVLPVHIKDNEVTKHLTGETRMSATIKLLVTVLNAKLGQGAPVLVDPAAASQLSAGGVSGMALRGDGGAGGAQSYAETHRRRKGVTPAMLQSERLLTDRGAYLSFLEVQLERVSAACLQVQGFDARIDGLSTQAVQNEEKLSNATKLVQLTQSYSEQQAAHFAERLAAMEGRTEGAASRSAKCAACCSE